MPGSLGLRREVRFDEDLRGGRDDCIAVTSETDDASAAVSFKREANGGMGFVGVKPSLRCVACQN